MEAKYGIVFTVALLAGLTVTHNVVDYLASKAAAIPFHGGLVAELALYVRTVLATQGFIKTDSIEDLTLEDTSFNPLLHPATITAELVKQALKAGCGHVVVPGSVWWIAK
ncbi:uncharacterized protein N7518_008340 [Penicillium psychrosexuale]|uniref:uncharacterized protein n=1 Tax=Penicillium psychrosexuale TaxID=1002107 RepID=UPI0025456069|nr:uncharacterized protein N7518_008340 [Penicillium psychrosexuale]KAJ5791329.1 hypothetical protein N7518_008340 [Penicillium psychrosexuale]